MLTIAGGVVLGFFAIVAILLVLGWVPDIFDALTSRITSKRRTVPLEEIERTKYNQFMTNIESRYEIPMPRKNTR
jgi:hypothetical protein